MNDDDDEVPWPTGAGAWTCDGLTDLWFKLNSGSLTMTLHTDDPDVKRPALVTDVERMRKIDGTGHKPVTVTRPAPITNLTFEPSAEVVELLRSRAMSGYSIAKFAVLMDEM